jgi:hypothetical protein
MKHIGGREMGAVIDETKKRKLNKKKKKKRHLMGWRFATLALLVGTCLLARTLWLGKQSLVDMWVYTTTSNGSLDHAIQFFITTNSELKMARSDTLHLEVTRSITSQLENFGTQVLKHSGTIHSGSSTDTLLLGHTVLEITVDTTNRELKSCAE